MEYYCGSSCYCEQQLADKLLYLTSASSMGFPSLGEKLQARAQLSNLSLRQQQAKATDLARFDWQRGKRGVESTD